MPLFFIHARNAQFQSQDEGAEYDHPQAALASGILGAMALITDEVNQGERSAAVEVSIQQKDGTEVLCSVVAVSVSPMMLTARPENTALRHESSETNLV